MLKISNDLVRPIYKLIEYSKSYYETTWNLWFYSKHESTNFNAVNSKAKLFGNTVAQDPQTNWSLKKEQLLSH